MVSVKLVFFCIFYFVFEAKCGKVSFIDPCKPDDRPCILESAKKAMPYIVAGVGELGLPSVDPLILETVVSDIEELKLKFKKLTLKGVSHCTITNIERNLVKSHVQVSMECPLDATGEYEASGKILFVDVQGKGPFYLKSEKIKVDAKIKIKLITGSDGQQYWEAARRSVSLEPIKKVHLDFQNLFNGDEQKAKPVHALLNNSSDDLVKSFGKPILEQLVDKIIEILNKHLLNEIPASELELS